MDFEIRTKNNIKRGYYNEKEIKNPNVANAVVKILEDRGIKYVFGIPGEENIPFVDAINRSKKLNLF